MATVGGSVPSSVRVTTRDRSAKVASSRYGSPATADPGAAATSGGQATSSLGVYGDKGPHYTEYIERLGLPGCDSLKKDIEAHVRAGLACLAEVEGCGGDIDCINEKIACHVVEMEEAWAGMQVWQTYCRTM